ncbi:hypothetical protein HCN44_005008 [Aphidius gifuensis]|uniref:CUB domain-containing protein n=1 Tax=Aphidius gifuensis TaxID=684658 RepID=A0A834XWX1_APHGI|nr:hypothetical protein HCN44_005008 [Aphidius gifuensis]
MAIYIIIIFIILNIYLLPSCFGVLPKSRGHPYYKTFRLVDEDICHPFSVVHKIDLKKYAGSALSISPGTKFNTWFNRTKDFECKFIVKAPKDESLFASIQSISFRKNGDECLDYVKFKRKNDNEADHRICGKLNRQIPRVMINENNQPRFEALNHDTNDDNYDDIYQYSTRYDESDLDGEIETTIFVSKKSLSMNENLNLTISYTPYKSCDKVNTDDYGPTTAYDICLWKEYFCDGIQNCASDLCADEQYCSNDIFGNGNNTKLTIGAIVTIILCLLKFLASLWICKRYKIFCWSPDCMMNSSTINNNNNDNSYHNNNTSRIIDNDIDNNFSTNQSSSVPPVLLVSVLPSSHDKDLPPSYESLFPERINSAATQS